MQKVIDVHNMRTAVHELFLVKRKPKTTLKTFREIEGGNNNQTNWNIIENNTEYLGEVHFRHFEGTKVWINRVLVSEIYFDDGENRYRVMGSYDIPM